MQISDSKLPKTFHYPTYKISLIKNLNLWVKIAKELEIVWYFDGGSLLGIIREGDLLGHDHDIDVTIDVSTLTPEKIGYINRLGLMERKTRLRKCFIDLDKWFDKTTKSDFLYLDALRFTTIPDKKFGMGMIYPFIDLLICYNLDGISYTNLWGCLRKIPEDIIFPVKEIDTKYGKLFVPNQVEKYLEYVYGPKWKIPNPKWKEKANCTPSFISDDVYIAYNYISKTGKLKEKRK